MADAMHLDIHASRCNGTYDWAMALKVAVGWGSAVVGAEEDPSWRAAATGVLEQLLDIEFLPITISWQQVEREVWT